jgi:hypothetical protein
MRAVMTNDPAVHPLTALDLVIGASTAPKRRRRRLESTLKAARKAGAGHVEIFDDKVVIQLAGKPAKPGIGAGSLEQNEWDEVLPGGDHGAG